MKKARGLELVTSLSSGYKTCSEKLFFYLCITWCSLMMYYKAVFVLFQKLHLLIYASPFVTSWINALSFVIFNLESVERKGKNYKNLNVSRIKRAFQTKWKIFFTVFEELSIEEKKADTSFKEFIS